VADPALRRSHSGRQAPRRCYWQRCHHHSVRTLQPRRSAQCRRRIYRPRRRRPLDGRPPLHFQHDDRMGTDRRLVPGRRSHDQVFEGRSSASESPWHRTLPGKRYGPLEQRSATSRPRCRLRRQDRARLGPSHPARLRPGHSPGHAVAGRNGEKEDRDPEGVPDLLRKLSSGRSGCRRPSSKREKDRLRREVLSERRQQVGAGRSRETRHLADTHGRGRPPASRRLWPLHRPGRRPARTRGSRHFLHQPQFQRPHGIARCPVLSREPGSSGRFRGCGLRSRSARVRGPKSRAQLHGTGCGRSARRRKGRDPERLPRA